METIDKYPQLQKLQELATQLRRIPADVSEWTEVNRNAKAEMIETVKRPGSAREQLAAEAIAIASKEARTRWNSYPGDDRNLMMAVVADVYDAAGDVELAQDARDTLSDWGVSDAKALLSEAAPARAELASEPPKPLQVEVVSAAARVHHAIRAADGKIEGSLEADQ